MKKILFYFTIVLLVISFSGCPVIFNPIEIPDQIANEGEEFKLDLTKYTKAIDIDKVTYSLKSELGRIDGKYYIWDDPDYEDSGQEVVISAKNERNVEKEGSFKITVNRIPEIEYLSPEIGSYLNDKVILKWEATDADVEDNLESQLKFDVYLGPSPDSLSKEYSDRTDATLDLTDDLTEDATHFWQVVAKDRNSTVEGDVWWFYVGNLPPNKPTSPTPSDGAKNIFLNTDLSWQCTDPNEDELTYDVYFGKNSLPSEAATSEITSKSFDPGVLDYETEYLWKIVAKDPFGEVATGTVWSFETREKPEYELTVTTTPDTSLTVLINGNTYSSPESTKVTLGDEVDIGVITPQEFNREDTVSGIDTRYNFNQWNDNNSNATRTVSPDTDTTYIAEMKKEFKVETGSEPEDAPTIDGGGWYEVNATQTFTAPDATEFLFEYWEINGNNAGNEKTIEETIDSPKKIVAFYNHIPTIDIPDQETDEGTTLVIDLSNYATDTDDDNLTYTKVNGVGEIEEATYTHYFNFESAGIHYVTIEVNDGRGGTSEDTFEITVQDSKTPHNPYPSDDATDVPVDAVLSWESSDADNMIKFSVYFDDKPITEKTSLQKITYSNSWDPDLKNATTYYWKVVADGEAESPVWSFTTE